ncbi:MAG: PEP-CTERM sorting domain-containing protein [Planctomycetota bacterium]
MKRTACTFLFLTACLATSTQAVTWSFDFESLDQTADIWGPESPPVATGAVEYDYQWELTDAMLRIEGESLPGGLQWIGILTLLPVDVQNGSGTENTVPFLLGPIVIDELDTMGISADILLGVLADGTATGTINNITFGTIGSEQDFDVTGIRVAGDFTVTPEPTTLLLLGLGAVMLRKRRRL